MATRITEAAPAVLASRDELWARVDAATGSDVVTAGRDAVARAQLEAEAAIPDEAALITEMVNAAAAGSLPEDYAEQLEACRVAGLAASHRRAALREVATQLEGVGDRIVRRGSDAGLAIVREQLETILEQAAGIVADLGPMVDSARTAIIAGKADAWGRLEELGEHYDDARGVQRALVEDARSQPGSGAELCDVFGVVADPDAHCNLRDYLAWREGDRAARSLIAGTGSPPAAPPWLHSETTAVLRFLTASNVEPWCPTTAQLSRHVAEVRRRIGTAPALGAQGRQMIDEAWRDGPRTTVL